MLLPTEWSIQVASDIIRDGLGLELLSATGDVIAEVFRSDADHTVAATTFGNAVSAPVMAWLLAEARTQLGPTFEDGSAIEWDSLT